MPSREAKPIAISSFPKRAILARPRRITAQLRFPFGRRKHEEQFDFNRHRIHARAKPITPLLHLQKVPARSSLGEPRSLLQWIQRARWRRAQDHQLHASILLIWKLWPIHHTLHLRSRRRSYHAWFIHSHQIRFHSERRNEIQSSRMHTSPL